MIQLANWSNAFLARVIEDVLVQVDELIFPINFYVLSMEEEFPSNQAPLILGRPFLKTTRIRIDVYEGSLFMEFGVDVVKFNIFYAIKHPEEEQVAFKLEILDILVQ